MPATLWGANELSKMLFGRRANPPANYYLALGVAGSPNDYMSGNEITEPSALSGYARLQLANNAATWTIDGWRTAYNATKLTFPSAITDWGTITYWALCTDAEDGEVYFYGTFLNPVTIYAGDAPIINAGSLKIALAVGTTIPELS